MNALTYGPELFQWSRDHPEILHVDDNPATQAPWDSTRDRRQTARKSFQHKCSCIWLSTGTTPMNLPPSTI